MTGRRIRVRGQVQGVGFRPFVWQLARRMGLSGHVLNDPEGVLIFVSGDGLDAFERALRTEAPVLARVDLVEAEAWDGEVADGFGIAASEGAGSETRVTPDAATCPACLAEISDPAERRNGYAFANCTHCGPRFSILNGLPYDRGQTSMAAFEMCDACRAEYEDPGDRRFHAQPIACAACGPKIWCVPAQAEPLAAASEALLAGQVVAIKGLGGFHLAVDATNAAAVALLRRRKHRPDKPFAVMGTQAMLRDHAAPSPGEWQLLRDAAAPIVLVAGHGLPKDIAPGQRNLGWMLPYTPLHHMLLARVGRPLVMTSGNLSGEPQVIGNAEALEKLSAFADLFVMHDRDIVRRLDDSVERVCAQGNMVLRRARGRVPGTLPLPEGFEDAPQGVAFGGQMKGALCLVKNGQALLGHHLGDLDDALTWQAFLQADRDYAALFDLAPTWAACDLHPEFRASRHAADTGLPLVEVQHHHAHLAACLAENGWPLQAGKVAGIILDGLGLGPDGAVWGGELLLGDYHGYERRAFLRPAPLPGGDMAQREPWRNLMVRLDQAGLFCLADRMFAGKPVGLLRQAIKAGVNAPLSSSAGRLFDGFAAGLGLVEGAQSYEGQAAMMLEAIADPLEAGAYDMGSDPAVIDPVPLFSEWAADRQNGVSEARMAMRFHRGLARAFATRARALVHSQQAQAVALSGGCFQNALLLDLVVQELGDVPILIHSEVPANDGGLALGQAVIAAASQLGAR